jgi:hypothetical protein
VTTTLFTVGIYFIYIVDLSYSSISHRHPISHTQTMASVQQLFSLEGQTALVTGGTRGMPISKSSILPQTNTKTRNRSSNGHRPRRSRCRHPPSPSTTNPPTTHPPPSLTLPSSATNPTNPHVKKSKNSAAKPKSTPPTSPPETPCPLSSKK